MVPWKALPHPGPQGGYAHPLMQICGPVAELSGCITFVLALAFCRGIPGIRFLCNMLHDSYNPLK